MIQRLILLAALLALAGCEPGAEAGMRYVTKGDIDSATALCAPNGGVSWVSRTGICNTRGCSWRYFTKAGCANGASFTKPAID